MFFKSRSNSNNTAVNVRLYKITDREGTVIEYVNVINNDFSNLWRIFRSRIGQPTNIIDLKNSGYSCTVKKDKYFIMPV